MQLLPWKVLVEKEGGSNTEEHDCNPTHKAKQKPCNVQIIPGGLFIQQDFPYRKVWFWKNSNLCECKQTSTNTVLKQGLAWFLQRAFHTGLTWQSKTRMSCSTGQTCGQSHDWPVWPKDSSFSIHHRWKPTKMPLQNHGKSEGSANLVKLKINQLFVTYFW